MSIHTTLRAANIARQAEWDSDNRITLTYRLNELAGETGEACNVGKKLERERLGIRGSRATTADLADELADVVICADLVALGEGIDLEAAVARKFNATSEKVGLQTRLNVPYRPSPEQVICGVARAVEGVLTVSNGGLAAASVEDIRSAIEGGVALAFAGLILAASIDPTTSEARG